ncbi:MAG: hypothetical protein EOO87_05675 [Pedobacter sp.]|nr:MAG: hypothetical protein EOO87_05675 [Pedobacter sp.]
MKNLIIILAFLSLTVKAQKATQKTGDGFPFGNIMPGPNNVSGFLTSENSFNAYLNSIKQYVVYKDAKGNGRFKKITSTSFPSSFAEFEQRAGESQAVELKGFLKVKSDQEAYDLLKAGDPKKISFAFFSKDFLRAIGAIWEDKEISDNSPSTVYRLTKVDNNGKEDVVFEQKLADVKQMAMPQYQLQNLISSDSLVQLTWSSKLTASPVYQAKIYKKASNEQKYQLASSVLVFDVNDSSRVSFSERVTPGKLFNYYVVPEDFAGNEGLPSDTAFTISKSFSQLKGIEDFKIADSLKGAWLSWKGLPNEGVYTGIQILKSRKSTDGFIEVATVSSTDSSYYDKEILPNVVYFYQLRPLTIGAKGFGLLPSASANIAVKNQNEVPFAPQGLKVWQDSTAQVQLHWDINPEIDQFAYYVLRGTSKEDMRIISPALRTNIYTDSLSNLDGQTTYFYGLKLMNISQKMSDLSTTVMFKPLKVEFVPYPSGISARYADGIVKLLWEDMIAKHDEVIGYKVYRKGKADKEFKLLNSALVNTVIFEDATAEIGETYEYGVTALNGSASQSVLSPVATVTIPISSVLAPPADLYLVNKVEGVYLSWPNQADSKNLNLIYRKASAEKDFRMIAEIPTDNYVDASAQKGTLYSYRIVAKSKLGNSNPGVEKSIRRN